jgi:hypothetical protein
VRREPNIRPIYWVLWAQARRSELAPNGYPKRVPWYTAPRLGNVEVDEPGSRGYITDDDLAVIAAINEALAALRRRRPAEVAALEIWEGAYVDAAPDRDARIDQWHISRSATKKAAWRAKLAVERYMFGGGR